MATQKEANAAKHVVMRQVRRDARVRRVVLKGKRPHFEVRVHVGSDAPSVPDLPTEVNGVRVVLVGQGKTDCQTQ